MNNKKMQIALGFLVLTMGGWGVYAVVKWAVEIFTQLNANVAASIVAGFATVIVSVITVILGRRLEANAVIRKEHREKKIPVYEDLLQFMSKMFLSAKTETALSEQEMITFMSNFTQRIMVWGSDDVIAHWAKFRTATIDASKGQSGYEAIFHYEELIYAIRRDLGHHNKGLTKGTILSLFVNDIPDCLE